MNGVDTLGRAMADLGSMVRDRLQGKAPELERAAVARDLTGFLEPLTIDECVVVLLALAPHVQPDFLTSVVAEDLPDDRDLPAFGGVRGTNHRGILPTGETAQFVLAGYDLERRLEVQRLFDGDHRFAQNHVLTLEAVPSGEPPMSGRIVLDSELVEHMTTGTVSTPRFSTDFPAEKVDTRMTWDDLVLAADTRAQVDEILHWVDHHRSLPEDAPLAKRVKPGFRALFHGPPGTGKTLTATLLGQRTGRDVFRVDLSRVVSKFIGDTEKNLASLFDKAEHKDWILFFDEADALFGKRTDIRDAHDKYANQEVSYLLQRIEGFTGLVILATNTRSNVDDAFLRRIQVLVPFPIPGADERRRLWEAVLVGQRDLAPDIDWHDLAARYELSGAAIVNVAQRCALEALARAAAAERARCERARTSGSSNDRTTLDEELACARRIDQPAIDAAILRELVKDGTVV